VSSSYLFPKELEMLSVSDPLDVETYDLRQPEPTKPEPPHSTIAWLLLAGLIAGLLVYFSC
jgi:hypothetical protein